MVKQIVRTLIFLFVLATAETTAWESCRTSRICNSDNFDSEIAAIKFTLNETMGIHFGVKWKLEYRISESNWKFITGLQLGLNQTLKNDSNPGEGFEGSSLSFGCESNVNENIIPLEKNASHLININFEHPPSVTVNESSPTVVNLKQCHPDIRYMGVVQRVEFYPLLLIKRSPNIAFEPLYADRSNNIRQCQFNKNTLGQECVMGFVNSHSRVLETIEMDVSRKHLINHYDEMRFIILDGKKIMKMYTLSIDDDGKNITASGACLGSKKRLLPVTDTVNYTITFTAVPEESSTELKIFGKQNDEEAAFNCSPICDETNTNSCLSTKKFTVSVKILLRNVIRNLQMTTVSKTCPKETEWVEGLGCQCKTPYSYFHHTSCSICTPGQICSPLGRV